MDNASKRNAREVSQEFIPYTGPFYLTPEEKARIDGYFNRNRKATRCYVMAEWLMAGLAKAEAKECGEARELRARMKNRKPRSAA